MVRDLPDSAGGILSYFTRHKTLANLLLVVLLMAGAVALPGFGAEKGASDTKDTEPVRGRTPRGMPETLPPSICETIDSDRVLAHAQDLPWYLYKETHCVIEHPRHSNTVPHHPRERRGS